jgi:cytosine/adenosine deaminase-related metal-dependent hydrolase
MALVIRGGHVLRRAAAPLERADVLIDRDRIVAIAPDLQVSPDAEALDARDSLVMPGLVNAHTHAHNNLLRNLATSWTLEDLLNRGTALYGRRSAEDQYLSAARGAAEMLRTGCTAAYDLFTELPVPTDEGVEAVVRAYSDVGLRAVVAPSFADIVFYHVLPGLRELLPDDLKRHVDAMTSAPTRSLLDLTERAIRRWHGSGGGRIQVAVSPTIPGHCTDPLLAGCATLAREHGVGIHTHLVETKIEAVHARQRWGKSIAAHLADIGLLGPRFVGAHSVWLTDEDIQRLADAGGSVAHNPASNLKLGCGLAPVRELLDHGVRVGLGTDGAMSSDNLDMFEAMRFAGVVGTVRFPYRTERWVDAAAVLTMATEGSAQLLGLGPSGGRLGPGGQADLVVLRSAAGFLRPLNEPVNALVYCETGADVDLVVVGGRVVVRGGQVQTIDESQLCARVQQAADAVRARNRDAWALADRLQPHVMGTCRTLLASPFPVNRFAAPIPAA